MNKGSLTLFSSFSVFFFTPFVSLSLSPFLSHSLSHSLSLSLSLSLFPPSLSVYLSPILPFPISHVLLHSTIIHVYMCALQPTSLACRTPPVQASVYIHRSKPVPKHVPLHQCILLVLGIQQLWSKAIHSHVYSHYTSKGLPHCPTL